MAKLNYSLEKTVVVPAVAHLELTEEECYDLAYDLIGLRDGHSLRPGTHKVLNLLGNRKHETNREIV